MASVDNRVVSISFDNQAFERNISSTIKSLEDLQKTLDGLELGTAFEELNASMNGIDTDDITAKIEGIGRSLSDLSGEAAFEGLNESANNVKFEGLTSAIDLIGKSLTRLGALNVFGNLQRAAQSFNLENIGVAVEKISGRFGVMGAVGLTVIQNLTNAAIDFGKKVGQNTIGQITSGGLSRALNIEQARFQFQGLGMDIESAMESSLTAVRGTAYGLDAAAKVAAQFGGAGVEAGDEMTKALRGISGIAAMTGRSYEEIGQVMTGIAGVGRVTGQDLIQFGVRGLNVAAQMAKAMGTTEAAVREMVSEGEIDFRTFAAIMDDTFGEHATRANEIYTGSVANLRAALSRIGASFQAPRLEATRKVFNALTPLIDQAHKALGPFIASWTTLTESLSDRIVLRLESTNIEKFKVAAFPIIDIFKNLAAAAKSIIEPIRSAFTQVFPPVTMRTLLTFLNTIKELTASFKMGEKTGFQVMRIFRGIFSALQIGWTVLKEVRNLFKDLFMQFAEAQGGDFLITLAKLGDRLTNLKTALVDGGGIAEFFDKIRDAIADPAAAIEKFKSLFSSLAEDMKIPGAGIAANLFERLTARIDMLKRATETLGYIWQWLRIQFSRIIPVLEQVWTGIKNWFSELKTKLAEALTPSDFDPIVDAVNIGLLGGILLMLKKFVDGGLDINIGGELGSQLGETLQALTGYLTAMQQQVKGDLLLKIAAAIAVLTASVVVLSMIDSAALTRALSAMAAGFAQLMGAFAMLRAMAVGPKATANIVALAFAIGLLSGALLILSISMKILASMSWEEIGKGLTAVTGLLIALSVAIRMMPEAQGMIRIGLSLILIAGALTVLALAMKIFATMSWEDMAKGLVGVGYGLVMIGAAMQLMPMRIAVLAPQLLIVSVALIAMAAAMKIFASMSWEEIGKGMVGIAGGLLLIAGAMRLMPLQMVLIAPALLMVAGALIGISTAVLIMSGLSWTELLKGILGLGAMLLVLAGALTIMTGAVGGAAALILAATGLTILTVALKSMSKMKPGEIITALIMFAGALAVLGIAAALMQPLIPALLALGAALTLVGLGFALFGVGALAFATAFQIIAQTGSAGIKVLLALIDGFIERIPALIGAIVNGLIGMAEAILTAAPPLIDAFVIVVSHIIDGLLELIPRVAELARLVIAELIATVTGMVPDLVALGFLIITSLLEGLADNIESITQSAIDILTTFIDTIAANMGDIVTSGINLLVSFLEGVAANLGNVITAGVSIVTELILGVANAVSTQMAPAVFSLIMAFTGAVTDYISWILLAGTQIVVELIAGIASMALDIITAGREAIVSFAAGLADNVVALTNAAFQIVTDFLNEMANVINSRGPELRAAGQKLIGAVLNEAMLGIPGMINRFAQSIKPGGGMNIEGMIKKAQADAERAAGVDSPSKWAIWMGEMIKLGFDMGLNEGDSPGATFGNNAMDGIKTSLAELPKLIHDMGDLNPTITPVLDLSAVQKDAKSLNGMLQSDAINPAYSYGQASTISRTPTGDQEPTPTTNTPREVKFEQNIYAPSELSPSDIYRQTRSQIAMAKEELTVP